MLCSNIENAVGSVTKVIIREYKIGVMTTHNTMSEMQNTKKPPRGLYEMHNAVTPKKTFWNANRMKIIFSAVIPVLALYWIDPFLTRENNWMFFLIFGYCT